MAKKIMLILTACSFQKKMFSSLTFVLIIKYVLKDTHREKAPSNKISMLSKDMNLEIWVICTSSQFFIPGSRFSKK